MNTLAEVETLRQEVKRLNEKFSGYQLYDHILDMKVYDFRDQLVECDWITYEQSEVLTDTQIREAIIESGVLDRHSFTDIWENSSGVLGDVYDELRELVCETSGAEETSGDESSDGDEACETSGEVIHQGVRVNEAAKKIQQFIRQTRKTPAKGTRKFIPKRTIN